MGNINFKKMTQSPVPDIPPKKYFEPVETFKFLEPFSEDTNNGLYLNNVYFPEEVIMMILSYVDPKELLKVSEVCRKWCNIIKSDSFWANIYNRQYYKKAKKLPWYVYYCFFTTNYFDRNLIKNGNGQEGFKHWSIVVNYGDQFKIEDPPCGANPLPVDVPEFNGKTSCFATSYYECNKLQEISLENNRLMQLIFDRHRPHIYLSEWVAARFDCGCLYNLWCKLLGEAETKPKNVLQRKEVFDSEERSSDESEYDTEEEQNEGGKVLYVEHTSTSVEQWAGSEWSKVEMVVKDYPSGVRRIVFQHEGRDTQFWKGHYGSKMAGGVLKILFDTIEPL